MLFDSSLYSFGDLPNDSFHQVKTTGEAGGLIRPCKGLSPAGANRALKIWQSHLYYRQPPSSGGSFTFSVFINFFLWIYLLFPPHP